MFRPRTALAVTGDRRRDKIRFAEQPRPMAQQLRLSPDRQAVQARSDADTSRTGGGRAWAGWSHFRGLPGILEDSWNNTGDNAAPGPPHRYGKTTIADEKRNP